MRQMQYICEAMVCLGAAPTHKLKVSTSLNVTLKGSIEPADAILDLKKHAVCRCPLCLDGWGHHAVEAIVGRTPTPNILLSGCRSIRGRRTEPVKGIKVQAVVF